MDIYEDSLRSRLPHEKYMVMGRNEFYYASCSKDGCYSDAKYYTFVLDSCEATNLSSIDAETIASIRVENRTVIIESDAEYRIYDMKGRNVTAQNGSLERGVYLVWIENKAIKVVVE